LLAGSALIFCAAAKSLTLVRIQMYNAAMENGIQDVTEKILTVVTFIAMGGAVAIVFFFMYAQFILGSKRVQHKLESLDAQVKRTNELLEEIARRLGPASGKKDGQ
jgi:hypothetical protein